MSSMAKFLLAPLVRFASGWFFKKLASDALSLETVGIYSSADRIQNPF
jgi:hypothetical protein